MITVAAIDRSLSKTLHAQIAAAIGAAIREGSVPAGSRLPSTRALAKKIGVSRNTVVAAYATLEQQSLVFGTPGSGTRVRGVFPAVRMPEAAWRTALRESYYPRIMAAFVYPDGSDLYLSSR